MASYLATFSNALKKIKGMKYRDVPEQAREGATLEIVKGVCSNSGSSSEDWLTLEWERLIGSEGKEGGIQWGLIGFNCYFLSISFTLMGKSRSRETH